jgi:hypothetical protein
VNSEKVLKKILVGTGKTLLYLGRGLYNVTGLLFWELKMAIQKHDKQAMVEEAERTKQQENDYEDWRRNYNAGRAMEQGKLDAQAEQEAQRRSERNQRIFIRNIEKAEWGSVPKVDKDYLNYDPFAPKRKRRN